MTKNVFIVHGRADDKSDKSYNKHWMPWLKRELVSRGFTVELPNMPLPWEPDYGSYKEVFRDYAVDENTTLIGHSAGCAFLVRWLGETKQKVNKLILVAPWKVPRERDKAGKEFYGYKIDGSIQKRINQIVMFTSNDEEEGGKKSLKIYQEAIGGRIVSLRNHGHYTLDDMGTEKFPELLEEVLK